MELEFLKEFCQFGVEFVSLSKQKIVAKNDYFVYLNEIEGSFDFHKDSKSFVDYSSKRKLMKENANFFRFLL